jgi:anti-sigma B factor antagonist
MAEARFFLRGEIDLSEKHHLEHTLARYVASGADLLIDCRHLDFIDSSGIAVLCDTDRALRARGHHMLLVNVTGVPLRVLEILGLTDLLSFDGGRAPLVEPSSRRAGHLPTVA